MTMWMLYIVLGFNPPEHSVTDTDIWMYCGEDFFFTLPSSSWVCSSLKKGLFYLGRTTCVSKAATYNIAQVQLHYHKHLLWFLMSFVAYDYFFLGGQLEMVSCFPEEGY